MHEGDVTFDVEIAPVLVGMEDPKVGSKVAPKPVCLLFGTLRVMAAPHGLPPINVHSVFAAQTVLDFGKITTKIKPCSEDTKRLCANRVLQSVSDNEFTVLQKNRGVTNDGRPFFCGRHIATAIGN
ncbi:hypothetical protein [Cupriavidus sp. H18C1]|uniref:hypothetical protein n=1 Tax=Cupriavidus sp. H18C1 TaxID=3241601 RepID=UPI003BB8AACB